MVKGKTCFFDSGKSRSIGARTQDFLIDFFSEFLSQDLDQAHPGLISGENQHLLGTELPKKKVID